jgi:hypothetical protein
MDIEAWQPNQPGADVVEEIARKCRLHPQNLANFIDDFCSIHESAQWLENTSRTTTQ